jgi:hypothetical protein
MLCLGILVKETPFNFQQFYPSTFCSSAVEIICCHGITLNDEGGLNINPRWEKLIKQ